VCITSAILSDWTLALLVIIETENQIVMFILNSYAAFFSTSSSTAQRGPSTVSQVLIGYNTRCNQSDSAVGGTLSKSADSCRAAEPAKVAHLKLKLTLIKARIRDKFSDPSHH